MTKHIVGIMLAAGIGKRFAPFTVQKPFFPFMGKTMIEHAIEDYLTLGVEEIILVVSPDKANTQINVPSHTKLTLVVQPEATGMGDAVLRCKDLVNHRPMIIRNGNSCISSAFITLAKQALVEKNSFIPATKVDSYLPYGYLIMSGNKAKGVIEKPGEGNEPSHFVKNVFDYYSESDTFFRILEKTTSTEDDVYEKALNKFMKDNAVECLHYQGSWQSLKYPWHVLTMMSTFLRERLSNKNAGATIASSAVIQGEVYLGKDVVVMEGAVIKGPNYIGDRTIIGTHTLVRESMIEADSEIGFGSEVVRSYIGDHCKIHTSYVGDSVLQSHVRLGARTTTANLRLDQKTIRMSVKGKMTDTKMRKLGALISDNVTIGIHVGLMPGVRIKSGTVIKPGEIVNET